MSVLFHNARKLDVDGEVDSFWMLIDGDTIVSVGSGRPPAVDAGAMCIDVGGAWLVPGFVDIHSHGGGGASFDDGVEEIRTAIATHRAHGTTRSVLSLVSNPIPQLCTSLAVIATLADADPTILGSHLEGPFLSDGKRGAHNPAYLMAPQPAEIDELLGAGRGTLRQLTIAPELPNAFEAVDILVAAGVAVAIGHTDADFELTTRAFERGARILTHAFNAMNGIHHRAPGPIIAAFEDDRVTIELILDGIHVHPDVAALAFRAASGRVALVTDAMAAAGAHDGDYRLGSLDVTVNDGRAAITGTDTIAGSTLTLDVAFRNAIMLAGLTPIDAVAAVTMVPAHALGLNHRLGRLAAGYAADAVILDHEFRVQRVWANGNAIAPS